MPRTRDGFVPLGDVSQAVALPGDRALNSPRRRVASATSLHTPRPGDAARAGERSRSGGRLHGAAARAMQPAAHQPRQPPASATTARDSTAACARSGRATCSSSGSSTASVVPSPTWSTPCRTCRLAAWACGCSTGKARRSTPPPPPGVRHLRGAAEFERELIRERTLAGLTAARARGGVVARIVTGPHDAHRQDPHLPIRYDTGRPSSVIRLRISQPRTTSLPCPVGLRARRPSPMMDL